MRLSESPPPTLDNYIVATYFLALRTLKLQEAAEEISYHASSGVRQPPADSFIGSVHRQGCRCRCVRCEWAARLVAHGVSLKMMCQPDGHMTSSDLLHTAAGAIIFDVYENQDARLVSLNLPDKIIQTFPGPAHGLGGVRRLTGFPPTQPAFGTILKPTAGITPAEVGDIVEEVARCSAVSLREGRRKPLSQSRLFASRGTNTPSCHCD